MLKYILTLFILYNGECQEEKVLFGADNKEFHLESSIMTIHAKKSKITMLEEDYMFYASGDTIYAVKRSHENGLLIYITSFKVENSRIKKIKSIMLTNTPCNQE